MRDSKLVVLDWGRTLHDQEHGGLFPGVPELVSDLSKRYTLALVSRAGSESAERRRQRIEPSGIKEYFKSVLVTDADKDALYEKVLADLRVEPQRVIVVDDRTVRGIAWGNRRGATTVWLCKGKFADEVPNEKTGEPTHTITDIAQLRDLLL